MGIEEDTFWDEHWVLYRNQFDNKFHNKNKQNNANNISVKEVVSTKNKFNVLTYFPNP